MSSQKAESPKISLTKKKKYACHNEQRETQYYFVSDIHNRNTRQVLNLNLYQPPTHLSLYQKGSYCMGMKLFNFLPLNLKKIIQRC
jgi:hypothetical protein